VFSLIYVLINQALVPVWIHKSSRIAWQCVRHDLPKFGHI